MSSDAFSLTYWWQCVVENDTVMNFIPIPTELKVDKVNIMLIKS